jgi:hypothetical protein
VESEYEVRELKWQYWIAFFPTNVGSPLISPLNLGGFKASRKELPTTGRPASIVLSNRRTLGTSLSQEGMVSALKNGKRTA